MATLANLVLRVSMDNDKFVREARKTERETEKLGASFGKLKGAIGAAGVAVAAVQAAELGRELFKVGAAAKETESKFRTVFGTASDEVDAFAQTFGRMAGESQTSARDLLATTAAISQGMGFAREASAEFSEEVFKLAADLGSFNNLPTAETISRVNSALAGEREGLKQLGIVIREADVQQRAMLDSGKELASTLTQQEKAAATLALITERAGVAVGDLARTQDSAANQARQVQAAWSDLKDSVGVLVVELGKELLPTLIATVDAVNGLILAVRRFFDEAAGPQALRGADLFDAALARLGRTGTVTADQLDKVRLRVERVAEQLQPQFRDSFLDDIGNKVRALTGGDLRALGDALERTIDLWLDNTPKVGDATREGVTKPLQDAAKAARQLRIDTDALIQRLESARQAAAADLVLGLTPPPGLAPPGFTPSPAEGRVAAAFGFGGGSTGELPEFVQRLKDIMGSTGAGVARAGVELGRAIGGVAGDVASAFGSVANAAQSFVAGFAAGGPIGGALAALPGVLNAFGGALGLSRETVVDTFKTFARDVRAASDAMRVQFTLLSQDTERLRQIFNDLGADLVGKFVELGNRLTDTAKKMKEFADAAVAGEIPSGLTDAGLLELFEQTRGDPFEAAVQLLDTGDIQGLLRVLEELEISFLDIQDAGRALGLDVSDLLQVLITGEGDTAAATTQLRIFVEAMIRVADAAQTAADDMNQARKKFLGGTVQPGPGGRGIRPPPNQGGPILLPPGGPGSLPPGKVPLPPSLPTFPSPGPVQPPPIEEPTQPFVQFPSITEVQADEVVSVLRTVAFHSERSADAEEQALPVLRAIESAVSGGRLTGTVNQQLADEANIGAP